jgi:hypothetical protein
LDYVQVEGDHLYLLLKRLPLNLFVGDVDFHLLYKCEQSHRDQQLLVRRSASIEDGPHANLLIQLHEKRVKETLEKGMSRFPEVFQNQNISLHHFLAHLSTRYAKQNMTFHLRDLAQENIARLLRTILKQ